MLIIKKHIYYLIFIILFISCTKDIQLNIPASQSEIVITGYIEQNQYPVVYLTSSFPFFSQIDSLSLYEQIIYVAKVSVTCEGKTDILTLKRDDNFYPPLYYQGTAFKGETGKRYDLKIEYKGNIATATTIIEKAPNLESLSFKTENDTTKNGHVYVKFQDDAATKNYYRSFTEVKSKDKKYYPTLLNTFDDQYFNGEMVEFKLYKGYKSVTDYAKNDIYFQKGDTILLKLCSIDKPQFDFWNSYQGKVLNITSFASSPNKLISNINGGIGIWGGYGSRYYQIIAK